MTPLIPNASMLARLKAILDAPSEHRLGLLGLGLAGRAMATFAARRGFKLVVSDRREDIELGTIPAVWRGFRDDVFSDCDGLLVSPGVDPRQPAVRSVWESGKPVFGELELIGELSPRTIAITGTNGKSTTTEWAGHLLRAHGSSPFVGGNLGLPLLALPDYPHDSAVIELSSFQLETSYQARFDVAVVLNVSPDHVERYDRFDDYIAAKARIVEHLGPSDTAILNADDDLVRPMGARTKGRVLWFSTRGRPLPGEGVTLEGGALRTSPSLRELQGFAPRNVFMPGRHNLENGIAALLATYAIGVNATSHFASFKGLPHRLEWVGEREGVRFINDSKATNDEAAATALEAMQTRVVLLCGGVDKGGGYSKLVAAAADRVRVALCFGEAGPAIVSAFGARVATERVRTLEDAFARARRLAASGDTVLLAPACSSFDQFTDYRARGDVFRHLVRDLERRS